MKWGALACFLALAQAADPAAPAGQAAAARLNQEGNRLYLEGRHEEALSRYAEALAAAPDSPEVRTNMANALYRLGRTEEALQEYAHAVGQATGARTLGQDARFNEGTALLDAGRFADAAERLRRVLLDAPEDDAARHNLELALARLQQQQEKQQQSQDGAQDQPQQDQEQDGGDRRTGEQDRSRPQEGEGESQGERRPQESQGPGEAPPQGDPGERSQEEADGAAPRPATPEEDLPGEEARRLLAALAQDERAALKEALQKPPRQGARAARDW